MAAYVKLVAGFSDNKSAQWFSGWLYDSGYTNKTLSQNTVTVTLASHGDRVVVAEEVSRRGGHLIEDTVEDHN
jgi:hypothetical protein